VLTKRHTRPLTNYGPHRTSPTFAPVLAHYALIRKVSIVAREFTGSSPVLNRSAVEKELSRLANKPTLNYAEEVSFEDHLKALETLKASERRSTTRGMNPFDGDTRTATRGQLRDRGLKVLETEGKNLAPFQQDHMDRLLRGRESNADASLIARRLIATESDAYRSAFGKAVTQASPGFTPEEAHALDEFRAANEGTGSAGGFGVPVLIDPTIILTSLENSSRP
jgi:hypothetical protein